MASPRNVPELSGQRVTVSQRADKSVSPQAHLAVGSETTPLGFTERVFNGLFSLDPRRKKREGTRN